jgi:hypothetical protein
MGSADTYGEALAIAGIELDKASLMYGDSHDVAIKAMLMLYSRKMPYEERAKLQSDSF